MYITLNNKQILVIITRKNNKNIYMQFINSDTLEVRANNYVTIDKIKDVLKKNEKALQKMLINKEKEEVKQHFFYYLGQPYTVIYDSESTKTTFNGSNIITKDERTLNRFYQSECSRVFTMELERILKYFENIPYFTFKMRYMKTRWGVNNVTNKVITLNTELLKKDLDLIDYVIIHELCHFYEANHSPKFWDWVSKYYPDYKGARRRLREQ